MSKTILHFGEILWDQFKDYKRAGGSPFNVSMHLHYLKHKSYLISAVGRDELGSQLLDIIVQKEGEKKYIERTDYPTGTVSVHMDENDEPTYTIHQRVAWDFIQPSDSLSEITRIADAFTFATLAQRSSTNRITLQKIIADLPGSCLLFFDVNLRPPYVQKPVLEYSMKKADYVKMNRAEWDQIGAMFSIEEEAKLLEAFDLKGIILTLGADGSIYFDRDGTHYVESAVDIETGIGDFVGVGDAFWACFIHHTLKGSPWRETIKKANRYAGWVAENKGGIPEPDDDLIEAIL
uniref:PfkB family carbohydrate kinase n=1 Tax=Rhodohalobacter sp. 8-1 TaxID=3131972 RepID=UPI0030EF46D4